MASFEFNFKIPKIGGNKTINSQQIRTLKNNIQKQVGRMREDWPEFMLLKIAAVYPDNTFDLTSPDEDHTYFRVFCIDPQGRNIYSVGDTVNARFSRVDRNKMYIKFGLGGFGDVEATIVAGNGLWIQSSGYYGNPNGISIPMAPILFDPTKVILPSTATRIQRFSANNTDSSADFWACDDETGLVVFNDTSKNRVFAVFNIIWQGSAATAATTTITSSTAQITEYVGSGNLSSNLYSVPLLGIDILQPSSRGRRGCNFFVDTTLDPQGYYYYTMTLQSGIYVFRSDQEIQSSLYSVVAPDASRDPIGLRNGAFSVFGSSLLEGGYGCFDSSPSLNNLWTSDPNPGSGSFDSNYLVAPNSPLRGQVWLYNWDQGDFTASISPQQIDLKPLNSNLLMSMGCGQRATHFDHLPANGFPIVYDISTPPSIPTTYRIWFSSISNDFSSHITIASIDPTLGTVTSLRDKATPIQYVEQYTGSKDGEIAFIQAKYNTINAKLGLFYGLSPNDQTYNDPGIQYEGVTDTNIVSNPGTPTYEVINGNEQFVGYAGGSESFTRTSFGNYSATVGPYEVPTPGLTATNFTLPHPLPGDISDVDLQGHYEDSDPIPSSGAIYPKTTDPQSSFSPSGVVGSELNHYLIASTPIQVLHGVKENGFLQVTGAPGINPPEGVFSSTYNSSNNTYSWQPTTVLLDYSFDNVTGTTNSYGYYDSPNGVVTETHRFLIRSFGQVRLTPIVAASYQTWLTKFSPDGKTVLWETDITDYHSWPGVAGTGTVQWVTRPATKMPYLTCCWQYEEVGDYVFVLRQHLWKNMSLSSIRAVDGPLDLYPELTTPTSISPSTVRDPYLDIYKAADGTLVGHVNLRIPSDVPTRAYTMFVQPYFGDGYPPKMKCATTNIPATQTEPAQVGSFADVFIAWSLSGATTFAKSSVVVNAKGAITLTNQILTDQVSGPVFGAVETMAYQQDGAYWVNKAPDGQGDALYSQPSP